MVSVSPAARVEATPDPRQPARRRCAGQPHHEYSRTVARPLGRQEFRLVERRDDLSVVLPEDLCTNEEIPRSIEPCFVDIART